MKKVLLAALLSLGLAASPAIAKSGVKVGVLNCTVAPGVGLIIASSKSLDCTFEGTIGKKERYKGTIDRLGIDIGFTGEGVMSWVVFAPGKLKRGALAGSYGGATAEATVAVGLGANVLLGGSDRSVALQPISVQAQTGLNVAAGVAAMRLKYVK
ncbi:DUF992 domain-containing protein [Aestuariivirga sp.]|jgi:hypothetical protein|uniref:DUF992 domain-containing protein n=1 Tax=Aestuariivirga sp. TaxID=2650926 RepID=UPI0037846DD5